MNKTLLATTTSFPADLLDLFSKDLTSVNATPTNATLTEEDDFFPGERIAEGMTLMIVAIAGVFLNGLILMFIVVCSSMRNYTNAFLVHSCLLDIFKSCLCFPFGLALLKVCIPTVCNALGLAYVISLTVSMFNLLAMVMSAAYTFHEKNVEEPDDEGKGAIMCVLFGTAVIYIGSIILHLGPTLIGGEIDYNEDVGNCTFAYGKVQNYIVQVIWVSIVSLTLLVILRYIIKFYRHLKANERFRITTLARNAAAYTKGLNPNESIYSLIRRLKQRVKVLLCMTILYFCCWYPLFILTLADYEYKQPRFFYRIATLLAWSHSVIIPLIFLTLDRTFNCAAARRIRKRSASTQHFLSRDPSSITSISQQTIVLNRVDRENLPVATSIEENDVKFSDESPLTPKPIIAAPKLSKANGDSFKNLNGRSRAEHSELLYDHLLLDESII